MDRLTFSLMAFSIALIAAILVSVRREHIRVESSVSWLAAAVVLLIVSSSRGVMVRIAAFLGIANPVSALLLIWGAVFIAVLYALSLRLSNLKDANIALT